MKRLGTVGIALIGLMALMQSLSFAGLPVGAAGAIGGASRVQWLAIFASTLLPFVALFAFGLILIVNRQSLADRWFEDPDVDAWPPAPQLLRVGLILVGVTFIAAVVPALVSAVTGPIARAIQLRAELEGSPMADYSPLSGLLGVIAPVIRAVIGVYLVARSDRIVMRLWSTETMPCESQGPALPTLPTCACGTPYDPADYRGALATPRCPECKEPLGLDRV